LQIELGRIFPAVNFGQRFCIAVDVELEEVYMRGIREDLDRLKLG
jgi:hypothetical protein